MKYATLAILCLAGAAFGAYSYDSPTQTLSLDQADLVNVIDPAGLATVQQSFGVDIGTFRALPGLKVVDFGAAPLPATDTPTSLQVNGLVKFNFGTNFSMPADTSYFWGGRNSVGRSAFSGTNTYDDISTVRTNPPGEGGAASWFDVQGITGANLSAVGFAVCAHNTGGYFIVAGTVKFNLDDGTSASVDYPALGVGTSPMLNQIWVGYQAPAGRHIVSFYALHAAGGSTDYLAIDDLSFVAGQVTPPQPHAGDCQNDGYCDVVDLGILAKNYDATGLAHGSGQSWGVADFNDDGNVDVVDLGILAKNYDWVGAPAGAAAVPEPATLSLLALAALGLIRRRK